MSNFGIFNGVNQSENIWRRAKNVIMDGTQLYSKGPMIGVDGVYPKYIKSGKGAYVIDEDENRFIDYTSGVGSVILGYKNSNVDMAIINQLQNGINFGLVNKLEVEVAELLCDIIPCAEKVRFFKTGAASTSAAIRLARAYTGKDLIIKGEYHGWHDWCMAASERNAGIPGDLKNSVVYCEYNDIDSFEKVVKDNDVAAIILEPTQLEAPRDGFLSKLRMLCDDNGVLLIFDEIVTGFRFSIGGAQEYFDVIPDLACFGKGIANGMPLSAVVGRSNIFDKVSDSIFMSTTFGGETLSLAACKANIQYMLDNNVCSYLWDIGAKIKDGFNIYCQDNDIPLECVGYPCRLLFISKLDDKELDVNIRSLFLQECVKGGVLMAWQVLPMFAHCNNDILYSINVFKDAASICAEAYINNNIGGLLQGKPVNWVEVL